MPLTIKEDSKIWKKIQEEMRSVAKDEPSVKIGVLGNAGSEPDGVDLVELAAIHEFGTEDGHIPERSFIRSTFRDRSKLDPLIKSLARSVLFLKMSSTKALGLLGEWGAARVKATITEKHTTGSEPQENAPSTIARKGSSTPLVDESRLINSISYEVVRGGGGDGDEE